MYIAVTKTKIMDKLSKDYNEILTHLQNGGEIKGSWEAIEFHGSKYTGIRETDFGKIIEVENDSCIIGVSFKGNSLNKSHSDGILLLDYKEEITEEELTKALDLVNRAYTEYERRSKEDPHALYVLGKPFDVAIYDEQQEPVFQGTLRETAQELLRKPLDPKKLAWAKDNWTELKKEIENGNN